MRRRPAASFPRRLVRKSAHARFTSAAIKCKFESQIDGSMPPSLAASAALTKCELLWPGNLNSRETSIESIIAANCDALHVAFAAAFFSRRSHWACSGELHGQPLIKMRAELEQGRAGDHNGHNFRLVSSAARDISSATMRR